MKRTITLLSIAMFVLLFTNFAKSQNPTYNLSAKNFQCSDSLGDGGDALTFDIVIEHTNLGASGPFEFALGQYYFNIDAASGVTSADYTYYIVPGSTQFSNPSAIPRGPTIVNPDATSPQGASLRVNSNTVLGPGNGPIVATFPGTRVCTMRLKKKIGNMPNPFTTNMTWRKALPNPFTKIFAYVGSTNTDISLSVPGVNQATVVGILSSQLISPANNSINNPVILDLFWKKDFNAVRYQLEVATDSIFNNLFYNDSYITDTTITLAGFNYSTIYYWRVRAFDFNNNSNISSTWNFTTQDTPELKLKLTAIIEGMYFPVFNQLTRKDTVTAELRQNISPYNIIASNKGVLDSINFTSALIKYPFAPPGTYYIVFKHFNSLDTWSKSGGVVFNYTDTTVYNFTSSLAQAYGNNLKQKGSKYCIISGDIDRDGYIDASDFSPVDNSAYIALSGRFLSTDLNGDNFVDADDLNIVDNNRSKGVIQP